MGKKKKKDKNKYYSEGPSLPPDIAKLVREFEKKKK